LGSYRVALVSTQSYELKLHKNDRQRSKGAICIYIMEGEDVWALFDGTEDLRQIKSRVLTLAIISAIIQHLKYVHDLVAATPFLQPHQHSFCI
jgi:hypothetical protein